MTATGKLWSESLTQVRESPTGVRWLTVPALLSLCRLSTRTLLSRGNRTGACSFQRSIYPEGDEEER